MATDPRSSDSSSCPQQKGVRRQLTSHYSNSSLFDHDAKAKLYGLKLMFHHENESEIEESNHGQDGNASSRQPVISDVMFCNCCQVHLADREEQVIHYKCDWHRYNLHLRLKGLNCVSEEEFEVLSGDVSSISGSEEDSEEDNDEPHEEIPLSPVNVPEVNSPEKFHREHRMNKIYFKNDKGELLSLYKCILSHKKSPIKSSSDLESVASQLVSRQKWAVFMVSSGHFAGAVFNGKAVVDHKTFHRYTVRAKRGTAQSAKDGQGSAPKSAGATLRRYNEAALNQEVQELLKNWKSHLDACSLIFVRIPIANRAMFYGGKNPGLQKDDLRIRVIPFPTRRPTYSEVKRVHHMLSNIECYGQEEDVKDFVPMSPRRFYCKETDELQIKLSDPSEKDSQQHPNSKHPGKSNKKEKDEEIADAVEDDQFDLYPVGPGNPLEEFEVNVGKKKRRQRNIGKSKAPPSEDTLPKNSEDEDDIAIKNSLFSACRAGNIEDLRRGISDLYIVFGERFQAKEVKPNATVCSKSEKISPQHGNNFEGENLEKCSVSSDTHIDAVSENVSKSLTDVKVAEFLSDTIGEKANTLLHYASEGSHHEVITILLQEGADPSVKNKSGKVPYLLGNNEVKNAYRRFMALYPDRYDYKKAQIPAPLTEEMEASRKQKNAEKRALRKKNLKEKTKAKKEEDLKLREEDEKKERFLKLSDREKRALAAERRILQQHRENASGSAQPVLSRCFQCGLDISGQVPFEYSEYKFCTTKCLRDHRGKLKS